VTPQEAAVLATARNPSTRTELQKSVGLRDREHFVNTYLNPLLEAGFLEMTIPDKPRSSKQKYRLTENGRAVVEGKQKDKG
jgi:ATP-dependent DNA helicase RecG